MGNFDNGKQSRRMPVILGALAIFVFIGLLFCGSVKAANIIHMSVVKSGTDTEVDTMWAYEPYEIRIKIQNDCEATWFFMALKVYNSALNSYKVGWEWLAQPDGCSPYPYITLVPGCRLNLGSTSTCYPVLETWEIWPASVDGLNIDTIGFLGINDEFDGMPPGPLEHMISLHFKAWPTTDTDGVIWVTDGHFPQQSWQLCIDVTYDEGEYLPGIYVVDRGWLCGDVNSDGVINIFDVTFLISYLYLSGPAPNPLESADVNNDGAVNIFDVTALISYLYLNGPPPNCP